MSVSKNKTENQMLTALKQSELPIYLDYVPLNT